MFIVDNYCKVVKGGKTVLIYGDVYNEEHQYLYSGEILVSHFVINTTNFISYFVGYDKNLYGLTFSGEVSSEEEYIKNKRKNNKMIYYAHPMNLYGTEQETRDLKTIKLLFPNKEILNPNSPEIQRQAKNIKKDTNSSEEVMKYFLDIIEDMCDSLIFRGLPNNDITAGVWVEIKHAEKCDYPVVELPCLLSSYRELSIDDTREYLKLIGNR